MYEPFNSRSAAVQQISQHLSSQASMGPDGLVLAPPPMEFFNEVVIPDRLNDKLLAIRMLKAIPLSYMIPDAALLPPESIRFFHVDQTWIDRVTDGLLYAANTGSVDVSFSCSLNQLIRQSMDKQMSQAADAAVSLATGFKDTSAGWDASSQPMTGMLMRSDMVRRWPKMGVRAYKTTSASSDTIGVLRAETISTGVLIALFAGVPGLVQVGEPHVGTRFGVEAKDPNNPEAGNYTVDLRDETGTELFQIITKQPGDQKEKITVPLGITLRKGGLRVIDISQLASDAVGEIKSNTGSVVAPTSRIVAIELDRQPWVQDFLDNSAEGITETTGIESSVDSEGNPKPAPVMSNGFKLSCLARLAVQQARNT